MDVESESLFHRYIATRSHGTTGVKPGRGLPSRVNG
jgi:hypothetical protein